MIQMLSIDTNILMHACNLSCTENGKALQFLTNTQNQPVLICELVLVELYVLLRNPKILKNPLSGAEAVKIVDSYRRHPKWKLIEYAPVMQKIWPEAAGHQFPRRQIFDLRVAYTLQHHGVTEFATANTKHFENLGFQKVWNPLDTQ